MELLEYHPSGPGGTRTVWEPLIRRIAGIWFTVWRGTLTEAYYPTVDRPQLRDMEYLVSDESTFFDEEKRVLTTEIERLERRDLGYRITNSESAGTI